MLVLSRKKEQSIIINGNVKVKVVEIEKDKVKLAIEAPKEIPIFREEIYIEVKEDIQKASQVNPKKLLGLDRKSVV